MGVERCTLVDIICMVIAIRTRMEWGLGVEGLWIRFRGYPQHWSDRPAL
jgi:hypothetical protein